MVHAKFGGHQNDPVKQEVFDLHLDGSQVYDHWSPNFWDDLITNYIYRIYLISAFCFRAAPKHERGEAHETSSSSDRSVSPLRFTDADKGRHTDRSVGGRHPPSVSRRRRGEVESRVGLESVWGGGAVGGSVDEKPQLQADLPISKSVIVDRRNLRFVGHAARAHELSRVWSNELLEPPGAEGRRGLWLFPFFVHRR